MKKGMFIRSIALSLVLANVLTGCVGNTPSVNNDVASNKDVETVEVENQNDITNESMSNGEEAVSIDVEETGKNSSEMDEEKSNSFDVNKVVEEFISEISDNKDETTLTKQQKNSFSMLYHLAITAEEIRKSKNNRLMLDDIYTSLLNDINPGAIDETTQAHLKDLRNIINDYISVSVKRERLQYIYNQNKASAMRSAVPNPLAVMSMTNSLDWKSLAIGAVYTVVDSYNNYKSAEETADREFLISGWDLDDEENEAFRKNRDRAFDYMVDIVQEYDLDGQLTLNEDAIEMFTDICSIDVEQQKIRRLESEESTYKLLGNYWLELAESYYDTGKYKKCLDCIEKYNDLSTGIYRTDYNYLQILPKAIVAAQNVYKGDEYVKQIDKFAKDIINNTNTEDWALRYFVAQVYLDLYTKTEQKEYLDGAYNYAYDNITVLVDEQRNINSVYLNEVEEIKVEKPEENPDFEFMTEDEQKELKAEYKKELKRANEYNKLLKNARKTELPSLYEPLILNCDLLFALAERININAVEKGDIEEILRPEGNEVFLSKVINERYSFEQSEEKYKIDFSIDGISIPVNLLSAGAEVKIRIIDNGKENVLPNCVISKVNRKENDFNSFVADFVNKELKKYSWTENSKVYVEVYNGDRYEPIVFCYKVKEYKNRKIGIDKVVFEEE